MPKQRSAREPYEPQYLNELREKVIGKFLDDTGLRGVIRLEFSSDKYSKTYVAINDQFNKVIGTTFDGQTLVRFFFRDLDETGLEIPLSSAQRFEKSTIQLFVKYVNTFVDQDETGKFFLKNKKIRGCDLIDWEFILRNRKNTHGHSCQDFYLAKQRDYCQWVGVINNWDYPRLITEKIIDEIKSAFEWDSAVASVIHGAGGCGKSTFLRRLAIRCVNERFVVLWVNSLSELFQNDLNNFVSTLKYLIIIEDWSIYENNAELAENFFSKVTNCLNIKVVIGDRITKGKKYRKHVLGNNYFELSTEQNDKILDRILLFNSDWAPIVEKLSSSEILNAPIFAIVFVIAREHSGETEKSTKGLIARFYEIIQDDLKTIADVYPGLVKALYYWACIQKKYRSIGLCISWEALIQLGDYFDNSNACSQNLYNYSEQSTIFKVLRRYLTFEAILVPTFKNGYLIFFNHDLFLEVISTPLYEFWFFDSDQTLALVEVLIDKGNFAIANCIINSYVEGEMSAYIETLTDIPSNIRYITAQRKIEFSNRVRTINKRIFKNVPYFTNLAINQFIARQVYRDIDSTNDEIWEAHMYYILLLCSPFHLYTSRTREFVMEFISKLIENGCKSELVKSVAERCKDERQYSDYETYIFEKYVEI